MARVVTDLENIVFGVGTLKHRNVFIGDSTQYVLIDGGAGKRIKVYKFLISCNLAASIQMTSGTDTRLFIFEVGANWGALSVADSRSPIFVANEGDDLMIQSNIDTDYNVYMQYIIE